MQGVQYVNSDRANSRRLYELPEGDWSVEVANSKATAVFCDDPEDLNKIKQVVGKLWKEKVPVGPIVYLDERISAGGVHKKRYQASANRTKAIEGRKLKPGVFLNYNNISEMVREEENEMMRPYANSLNMRSPSEKLDAINAIQLYNNIFRRRLELGLNVYFEKDLHGNKNLKFLRKKNDKGEGIEVSREYVNKAIKSLNAYYLLSRSGEWEDLREAESIAKKFFTEEGKRSITRRIYNKAVDLADAARSGMLDTKTSKQIYVSLVKSNKTNDLSVLAKAADIAELYMPRNVADNTAARLKRLARLQKLEQRGVRLDGDSGKLDTIVSLEKRIKNDPKLGKTRQIGELTTGLISKAPIVNMPKKKAKNPISKQDTNRKIRRPKHLRSRRGFAYEKGITQQEAIDMVEDAETALKVLFRKNGGNVLSKSMEWPSEKRIEWNRSRAENVKKWSSLPPHPEDAPITLVRTPEKVLAKIREHPEDIPITLVRTPEKVLAKIRRDSYEAPPTIVRKAPEVYKAA